MPRTTAAAAPGPGPRPGLGAIVLYALSDVDAAAIDRRREDWRNSPPAHWGYQAHVGSPVRAGQRFPAVVVGTFGGTRVNLSVLLDGSDTLWIEAAEPGDDPGTWSLPPS